MYVYIYIYTHLHDTIWDETTFDGGKESSRQACCYYVVCLVRGCDFFVCISMIIISIIIIMIIHVIDITHILITLSWFSGSLGACKMFEASSLLAPSVHRFERRATDLDSCASC